MAYNRPRQYDLFEFEQHNRQFLFLDGKLYTGDNIHAGELGHVIIDPHSRRRCYCGQCGCFDAICNVAVLESCAGGSLSRFFEQLAAEEKDIKKVWNTYTNHLALAIHNLKMMLDCTIIIGGCLGAEIGPFIDDLYRKIDKLSVFTPYSKAYVYPCKYKREATGSKITGGFCVTRQGLLLPSKLGHILTDTPSLLYYEGPDGTFVPYKGRAYCWTAISASGEITLTEEMMVFLHLKPEMRLILQGGFIRQMQCVICDHCRRHRPAERIFD